MISTNYQYGQLQGFAFIVRLTIRFAAKKAEARSPTRFDSVSTHASGVLTLNNGTPGVRPFHFAIAERALSARPPSMHLCYSSLARTRAPRATVMSSYKPPVNMIALGRLKITVKPHGTRPPDDRSGS